MTKSAKTPILETATDTVNDLQKDEQVYSRRITAMFLFLIPNDVRHSTRCVVVHLAEYAFGV